MKYLRRSSRLQVLLLASAAMVALLAAACGGGGDASSQNTAAGASPTREPVPPTAANTPTPQPAPTIVIHVPPGQEVRYEHRVYKIDDEIELVKEFYRTVLNRDLPGFLALFGANPSVDSRDYLEFFSYYQKASEEEKDQIRITEIAFHEKQVRRQWGGNPPVSADVLFKDGSTHTVYFSRYGDPPKIGITKVESHGGPVILPPDGGGPALPPDRGDYGPSARGKAALSMEIKNVEYELELQDRGHVYHHTRTITESNGVGVTLDTWQRCWESSPNCITEELTVNIRIEPNGKTDVEDGFFSSWSVQEVYFVSYKGTDDNGNPVYVEQSFMERTDPDLFTFSRPRPMDIQSDEFGAIVHFDATFEAKSDIGGIITAGQLCTTSTNGEMTNRFRHGCAKIVPMERRIEPQGKHSTRIRHYIFRGERATWKYWGTDDEGNPIYLDGWSTIR